MQTIKTTFLPATNSRGARIRASAFGARIKASAYGASIKASAYAGSLTIPFPYELNSEEAHALAAVTFAKKLGWAGELISGSDEKHYYFNFTNSSKYLIT